MAERVDIVTFLTARLDEDEADARAAIADRSDTQRWEAHGWRERNRFEWIVRDAEEKYASHGYPGYTPVATAMPGGPRDGQGVAAHIARHDPARVLREVAAKRKLLEWCARVIPFDWSAYNQGRSVPDQIQDLATNTAIEMSLKAMAAPYLDHPDFDSRWCVE